MQLVAICIPAYRDPKAQFTDSLAGMLDWSARQPDPPTFNRHWQIGNPLAAEARELAAEEALKANPHYLLWLDVDHEFPEDTYARLAVHDLPIVGCNYRKHIQVPVSSASKLVGGRYLPITPMESGLEVVDAIGFGVCLIKSEVFRKLPRPWFGAGGGGEDAFFCRQAKAAGYPVYVDHSIKVGHAAEVLLYF